jgi:hypothetical protein
VWATCARYGHVQFSRDGGTVIAARSDRRGGSFLMTFDATGGTLLAQ